MLQYLLTELITEVAVGESYHSIQQYLTCHEITNYIEFMEMDEVDFVNPRYRVLPTCWNHGDAEPPERTLKTAYAKKIRNLKRWLRYL